MTDVLTTCVEAIFRVNLTLKMASAQVVETSVNNNSPFQDSNHPGDLFQSRNILYILADRFNFSVSQKQVEVKVTPTYCIYYYFYYL